MQTEREGKGSKGEVAEGKGAGLEVNSKPVVAARRWHERGGGSSEGNVQEGEEDAEADACNG